jgi:23S rRNA pseudouridine2605 synthase
MTRKSPHSKTAPRGKRAPGTSAAPIRRPPKFPAEGVTKNAEDAKDSDRIAKVIARAGLASRREAEQWIVEGRVSVNGAVIASPALNVTTADRIAVDGKALPQRERTRLFLFHKPRGLVTTHVDPQERPTIFSALPANLPRLISVGRLDINTEGLLLLTNDGGLARVLELPETAWLRRYRVRAHGRVLQPALDALRDGVEIDGIKYGAIEAKIDREQGANVWITFAIREGKNREVRNVLRHLDLQVNRLIRVSFGPFQLGELAEGGVEEIKTRTLRDQLGERIAADAHVDFSAPILERDEKPVRTPPREDVTSRGEPERKSRFKPRQDGLRTPPVKEEARAPHAAPFAKPFDKMRRGKPFDKNWRASPAPDGAALDAKPVAGKRTPAKHGSGKRSRNSQLERFGGPEMARRERKGLDRKPHTGKGTERPSSNRKVTGIKSEGSAKPPRKFGGKTDGRTAGKLGTKTGGKRPYHGKRDK